MQIICMTTTAAAQVLMILLTAKLWPRYDYELRPVISTTADYVYPASPTHRSVD
jgi:hypothetical protein